jgi:CubicO group peptidase (beta-lactamase class C family)
MRVVADVMATSHLRAAIVRVTRDGRDVATRAVGESMTGVPATTDMHFRNGAVAISYVSTLLLRLVDEGRVALDDRLSTWLPEVPHADQVTLGQLATMTSGYVDYVIGNTAMNDALYANPFRQWTTSELLAFAVDRPLQYPPGTNWNYAHTNYVLLGLALERATGEPMSKMLSEMVLRPLGLSHTVNSDTAEIPSPVLHAFTSERRAALRIPTGVPFYEESTYWNPSWTITHGAIETSTVYDLEATAVGIGSGRLLSRQAGVHRPARPNACPAGVRHLRPDDRWLHLRHGSGDLRRLAAAESDVRRFGRRRGLPALAPDRDRRRRDVLARGVRRTG